MLGVTAATIVVAGGTAAAFAADEDGWKPPFFNQEKIEEIKGALENGDYDTWSSVMNEQIDTMVEQAKSNVTEDTFSSLQEVHQLLEEGKVDEARELAKQLHEDGLGPMFLGGKGKFGGHGPGAEHREEMKAVLESGDYEQWAQLMEDRPGDHVDDMINEDTFNKMIEAHTLMQEGDKDGARAIMDELGIGGPGKGLHPGRGMGTQGEDDVASE